jgi:hypothetical protein
MRTMMMKMKMMVIRIAIKTEIEVHREDTPRFTYRGVPARWMAQFHPELDRFGHMRATNIKDIGSNHLFILGLSSI